ncbi:MAG: type IV pilin protein [Pseudomonadales bacterium]|nr:type IV pilin protein [Pseudomonadales bacterium]
MINKLRSTHTQHGVTLVELLIVVTVVGILAAIAVPSYRAYVVRTNRTEAKVALQSHVQRLERCFVRTNNYFSPQCLEDNSGVAMYPLAVGDDYVITIAASALGAGNYDLAATPQGAQAGDDTECGTFTIDNLGNRSVSGSASATAVASCWDR